MRKLFLALALCTFGVAQAQIENDKNCFNHLSVALNAGTNGLGLELGTVVTPNLGIRAGYEFMPGFTYGTTFKFKRSASFDSMVEAVLESQGINLPENGSPIDAKAKLTMSNAKLLLDYYPSRKSMFHFTAGVYVGGSKYGKLYGKNDAIKAVSIYNELIKEGYVVDDPDNPVRIDLGGYALGSKGSMSAVEYRVNSVKPYLGIGIGRTIPRKQIGCMFEFGLLYVGSPKLVDIHANDGAGHEIVKEDFPNNSDGGYAVRTLRDIPVYPNLKISLVGKIF